MLFDDTYRTIKGPSEAISRDRGSKFIAFAYPLNSDADIKDLLASLKFAHPKADHHCWAARLGVDRSVFRINDDGEPSGTAGRPILNTLLSKELTNILVVVVRYFGGTLLGVPGLINAYRSVTEEVIGQSIIITKTVNDIYTAGFEFLLMNDVMKIIKEEELIILKQDFDNSCKIQVSIRKTLVNQVIGKLNKITGVDLKYNYTL